MTHKENAVPTAASSTDLMRATDAGWKAARAGREVKACPYSISSERTLALAWLRGYQDRSDAPPSRQQQVKAPKFGRLGVARWDEDAHPRDREGQFIETGGQVRATGGVTGTVVRALAGGRIEIRRDSDGKHIAVHKGHLTVVEGPGGAKPSSEKPTTMPAQARRFDDTDDVAAHWRAGGDLDDDALADAADNDMVLSAGGSLVAVRNGDGYDLVHAGTGLSLGVRSESTDEAAALTLAAQVEGIADADGRRFDWAAPGIRDRMAAYRDPDGRTLAQTLEGLAPQPTADADEIAAGNARGYTPPGSPYRLDPDGTWTAVQDPAAPEDVAKPVYGEQVDATDQPWTDEVMSIGDLRAIAMQQNLDPNSPKIEAMAADIAANGIRKPLQVEETNRGRVLGDGGHRLLAAEQAGLTEVPVRVYANTPAGRAAANRAMMDAENEAAGPQAAGDAPATENGVTIDEPVKPAPAVDDRQDEPSRPAPAPAPGKPLGPMMLRTLTNVRDGDVSASAWGTNLSRAQRAGYIERGDDRWRLTAAGQEALAGAETPTTPDPTPEPAPAPEETREQRRQRMIRENEQAAREGAGLDDRWTHGRNHTDNVFGTTITRLQPGDVVYTRDNNDNVLLGSLRGGIIPTYGRKPRMVQSVDKVDGGFVVRFTDGTYTPLEENAVEAPYRGGTRAYAVTGTDRADYLLPPLRTDGTLPAPTRPRDAGVPTPDPEPAPTPDPEPAPAPVSDTEVVDVTAVERGDVIRLMQDGRLVTRMVRGTGPGRGKSTNLVLLDWEARQRRLLEEAREDDARRARGLRARVRPVTSAREDGHETTVNLRNDDTVERYRADPYAGMTRADWEARLFPPAPTPDPAPAPEPVVEDTTAPDGPVVGSIVPADGEEVTFGDLAVGDRVGVEQPDGSLYDGLVEEREEDSRGDITIDVRYADGSAEQVTADSSAVVVRIPAARAAETPPTPAGPVPHTRRSAISRVSLRTAQRQMVNGYALDTDEDQPEIVRTAAARIRARQALTADEHRALAGALRRLAASDGVNKRRAGALDRAARQFDVAEDSARVNRTSRRGAARGETALVRNLAVGQTATIPATQGYEEVEGTVVEVRQEGRTAVRTLVLDTPDGRVERTLLGGTAVRIEPVTAPPAPNPEPESTLPRPGTAAEIGVGDIIAGRYTSGKPFTMRVTRVEPAFGGKSYRVFGVGSDDRDMVGNYKAGDEVTFLPPLPADKPIPPPVEPDIVQVDHAAVRVGDRVVIPNPATGRTVTGVVTARTTTGDGDSDLTILDPFGRRNSHVRSGDEQVGVIENLGEQWVADTLREQAASKIASDLRYIANQIHEDVARAAAAALNSADYRSRLPAASWDVEANGERLRENPRSYGADLLDLERMQIITSALGGPSMRDRISRVATALGGEDAAKSAAERARVMALLGQQMSRAIDGIITGVREYDGNDLDGLLRFINTNPPEVDYQDALDLLAETSPALNQRSPGEAAGTRPPAGVPASASIRDRVAALRASLPEQFGSVYVERTAYTADLDLAALQRGETPAVDVVRVPVPDKAADGGPGVETMQHLETVKAAGRIITEEVDRRLADEGLDLGGLLDRTRAAKAQYEAAKAAREEESSRRMDGIVDLVSGGEFSSADGLRTAYQATGGYRASQLQDWYQEARRRAQADTPESNAAYVAMEEARTEWGTLSRQVRDMRARLAAARSRVHREVLAEVRPMGPAGLDPADGLRYDKGERAESVRAMRWAEQFYPTSWLARGSALITTKTVRRGFYNNRTNTIALSAGSSVLPDAGKYGSTAVHELGHHMEKSLPGLMAAEDAFLWSRTTDAGTEIGSRTRKAQGNRLKAHRRGENAREDQLNHWYTAREYDDGFREVLTTTVEQVFGGEGQYVYNDEAGTSDDDLRAFVMGALATFGTVPAYDERDSTPVAGQQQDALL